MSVITGIAIFTLLLSIPLVVDPARPRITIPKPKMYEWPFIIVILFLMLVSAWRCFYYPPTSRDMLTGPELLAEYAVREKTMVSSVFTIDLSTTNNYFKSPYITGLQIMYKLLVSQFGQLWLVIVSFSFVTWLYTILRARLHPVLAGLILMFFIAIPEMYAYSYLILYDYSNAVFFFLGFYFLTRYLTGSYVRDFFFSAFLFGLATYIRTETIVLVAMLLPLPFYYSYRKHIPVRMALTRAAIFILLPFAFYLLCQQVFIRNFIPFTFNLQSQINADLGNVSVFFIRLRDMSGKLLFSKIAPLLYGDITYAFVLLLIADLFWPRRFNRESLIALYGVAVVYIGLAFLGYLLPLMDLMNTTKRGLFKIMPILLLYMSNSGLLLWLSARIRQWTNNA